MSGNLLRSGLLAAACTALLLPALAGTAAAATPSQVTAQDQATILADHNTYRAEVHVPPLVWDARLAQDAQAWVESLAARGGDLDHGPETDPLSGHAKGEGENLFLGRPTGQVAAGWYEEKEVFDADDDKTTDSPNWEDFGHYTQMVWRSTTKVGCGTVAGPMGQLTSCRYSAPGNYPNELPY